MDAVDLWEPGGIGERGACCAPPRDFNARTLAARAPLVIAVDVVSALYVITVRDAAIIISRVRQHPVRDGPIAVLALSDSELGAWVRAKV